MQRKATKLPMTDEPHSSETFWRPRLQRADADRRSVRMRRDRQHPTVSTSGIELTRLHGLRCAGHDQRRTLSFREVAVFRGRGRRLPRSCPPSSVLYKSGSSLGRQVLSAGSQTSVLSACTKWPARRGPRNGSTAVVQSGFDRRQAPFGGPPLSLLAHHHAPSILLATAAAAAAVH